MMNTMFAQYDLMKKVSDAQVARIKADYRKAQDPSFLGRFSPAALLITVAVAVALKLI